jgi:hypothetical protein
MLAVRLLSDSLGTLVNAADYFGVASHDILSQAIGKVENYETNYPSPMMHGGIYDTRFSPQ